MDWLGGGLHQNVGNLSKLKPQTEFVLALSCSVTCTHPWARVFSPQPWVLSSRMAYGHGNPTRNALQLGHKRSWPDAGLDWTGLQYGAEAVGGGLVLLKARWDFFHSETERNETSEGNPLNFTSSVRLSTKPHQEIPFLAAPQELTSTGDTRAQFDYTHPEPARRCCFTLQNGGSQCVPSAPEDT